MWKKRMKKKSRERISRQKILTPELERKSFGKFNAAQRDFSSGVEYSAGNSF